MSETIHDKMLNESTAEAASTSTIDERPPSASVSRLTTFSSRFRKIAPGLSLTLGRPVEFLRKLVERVAPAMNRRVPFAPVGITLLAACGMLSTACGDRDAGAQEANARTIGLVRLNEASIWVGGRERRFEYYVPARPTPRPPIVLAFHGSDGSGKRLREFIGGELERLAERRGFIVVYPEGFEGNWNGCRASSPSSANRLGIDDVGFVRALVGRLGGELGADTGRASALGFSGGGHMAYRLALEIPELIPAVAVIAASLPVAEELDCRPTGRGVSVMIVNGTADPVNPYGGGDVVAPTGMRLGQVRPTLATAEYFARLAGNGATPSTSLTLAPRQDGGTWVEEMAWSAASSAEVALVTIHGGGHTIPGPRSRLPEFVGPTERRFSAVREAVSFLLRRQ